MEFYIANRNGGAARAARAAGCPPAGSRMAACRLMREPVVRAAVDAAFNAEDEARRSEREARRLEREALAERAFQAELAKAIARVRGVRLMC